MMPSSTRATDATRQKRRLEAIPGIGSALAAALVRRGATTRAQLRAIIDELPRETRAFLRYNVSRAISLAEAVAVASELRARLTFASPSTGRWRRYPTIAVGSVRRRAERSKDIDLLVVVPDDECFRGLLASAALAEGTRGHLGAAELALVEAYAVGTRRCSFIVRRAQAGSGWRHPRYYAVDLFLATEKEKPYALFHFTGGRAYNIRIRAHAKRASLILNQYGLFCASQWPKTKRRRAPGSQAIRTEAELMRFLGVRRRSPEEREG